MDDLLLVTLSVDAARFDAVCAAYERRLGWDRRWTGTFPAPLASALGVRPGRAVMLGHPAEGRGLLRIVEGDPPPAPFTRAGWNAAEVTICGVDTLQDAIQADSDFCVNGPLRDLLLAGEPTGLRAMQATAAAGEQLYLTEITAQLDPPLAVPPHDDLAGAIFVAVLAALDLPAAVRFYQALGLTAAPALDTAIGTISRERGDPDAVFRLQFLRTSGETCIEVNGYPPSLQLEPIPAGGMPGGWAIVSFSGSGLQSTLDAVPAAGGEIIAGPLSIWAPPYHGVPVWLIRGPSGELVELCGTL